LIFFKHICVYDALLTKSSAKFMLTPCKNISFDLIMNPTLDLDRH